MNEKLMVIIERMKDEFKDGVRLTKKFHEDFYVEKDLLVGFSDSAKQIVNYIYKTMKDNQSYGEKIFGVIYGIEEFRKCFGDNDPTIVSITISKFLEADYTQVDLLPGAFVVPLANPNSHDYNIGEAYLVSDDGSRCMNHLGSFGNNMTRDKRTIRAATEVEIANFIVKKYYGQIVKIIKEETGSSDQAIDFLKKLKDEMKLED